MQIFQMYRNKTKMIKYMEVFGVNLIKVKS